MNRKALGRGLGALIPEAPRESAPAATLESAPPASHEIPVERIRPNPYQPRTGFDPEALAQLAASIRENGLIQPLVVRDAGNGTYELIAGERRFLASKQAGFTHVPVVVRQATRREMLEVALVENLQREDLNPIEEAEAYHRLATEFGLTQEEIAARVGRSRAAVTNALRLLGLESEFQEMLAQGTVSAGHARALLALPTLDARRRLAREIRDKGLSVRQAELMVQGERPKPPRPTAKKRSHPALEAWEDRLRTRFGTQARIVGGLARGKVELYYFSHEDLERILDLAGAETGL
jgi:ParB family transcriptional regulator, chromosome partitioning protein